ncbi:putative mitochondrial protein AtMg01250 [Silene latifolia]|uniref:putative mitochondrial protein AtMg01250 n=1 Tax=Silene latifolia TaxID=37657 RepID=UPI003D76A4E8
MVTWIVAYVSTPWFTISQNGSCFGYFQGKRGIRQGDPMSPLLFTLCMEYLSRRITKVISRVEFNYHPLYRPLKLNHLCFADDLLMFCRGNRTSIKVLLRAFATFSYSSGLEMNNEKSDIYFNGIAQGEVDYILRISVFKAGIFRFRYLGIPISYKIMGIEDCTRLVEKVVATIRGWGPRCLVIQGDFYLLRQS